jgi:chemotaxis protein methyltransferase CheR
MDYNYNPLFNVSKIFKSELSEKQFDKLSQFIMTEYGIKMPLEKKIMLQSRLQKRLKALNMDNFDDYFSYLFSPHGMSEEVIHMMDVVSTNKTDFFRESSHFDFMLTDALPSLVIKQEIRNLKLWSAGCSSGEEPYTIAITISEFLENHTALSYSILATDISTQMLKNACNAIYNEDRIKDIPLSIKKKYFLRSKNREDKKVKIIAGLRKQVEFERLNLLELTPQREPKFHIIFCRNVLIYFDRPTQYKILSALCTNIIEGGYLFLGHSESISGFDLPLNQIVPTVFSKKHQL